VLLRYWEAGARTLPLMAALSLPVLLGLPRLYPWANPAVLAADPLLAHKAAYLNLPFFVARTAAYVAIWWGLLRMATRRPAEVSARSERRRLGALGLMVMGLTASFASIDWIMSLEPHWYSSIYGAMVAMGILVGALALGILSAVAHRRRAPVAAALTPQLLNDLGSLLLGFVLLWGYLAFSQYLIIWYGDVPEEVTWYTRRLSGGWEVLAAALVGLSLALPFGLLLSRDLKRQALPLGLVAGLVLLTRYLNGLWLSAPAFYPALTYTWLDAALGLGLGLVWGLAYRALVRRHWPAALPEPGPASAAQSLRRA
jgi:hypothetical protein